MEYGKFVEVIEKRIRDIVGEGYDVSIRQSLKNNSTKLCGIVISKTDEKISPSFYLESYYDKYNEGMDIDAIAHHIVSEYRKISENGPKGLKQFKFPNTFEDAKERIIARLFNAHRCAEQYGVTVAIEPVARHIVYDAKRARLVLDEIGSHNLQILLDPVNMLSMDNVDRREEVFAEAIELLGKDVAMIHFKDFLRHDADGQLKACGAGQGEMEDYSTILRFAKQEKPFVFATLENTTPENAVACREFLQKQYDNC